MVAFERRELDEIALQLRARREVLVAEIRDAGQRTGGETQRTMGGGGGVGDQADEAAASALLDDERAGMRRDEQELAAVDAALARIDGGTYGLCVACGEAIAPARLRANPSAARCIGCQGQFERAHGMAGGPSL